MQKIQTAFVVSIFLSFFVSVSWAFSKHDSWQLGRLLQPQENHISQESKGKVFIYDGLYEADIQSALDQQFDRIEYMMFVRTKVDENGEVSETDDCD